MDHIISLRSMKFWIRISAGISYLGKEDCEWMACVPIKIEVKALFTVDGQR